MGLALKPLEDQVVVITGASSGIGLATARLAAQRGARLVLAARNLQALEQLAQEIEQEGGEAIAVATDVSDPSQVEQLGERAIEHFGHFDSWINNAGTGIYGKLLDISHEESRRMFDINFWGVVYGSHVAAHHFLHRQGDYAGALINVGSTVSDRALPIQGMYSASKHAVKGFTDALRMELEADQAPISVSLVKPGSINTPWTQHARNYMDREPKVPPPVYEPAVAARAILHCTHTPVRDVYVGSGGKITAASGKYTPRLTDLFMERAIIPGQQRDEPPRDPSGALDHPSSQLQEHGDYPGYVSRTSFYTAASLHPVLSAVTLVGVGLGIAALWGVTTDDRR